MLLGTFCPSRHQATTLAVVEALAEQPARSCGSSPLKWGCGITQDPSSQRNNDARSPVNGGDEQISKDPRAPVLKPPSPATAYVSKYAVGDQISHAMFGDGTVAAIDANKLTIEFPGATKQIVDDFVKHR